MSWIYLFVAGLLEIGWAYFMKRSDGFSKFGPSVITIALMVASFGLLGLALRQLPVGTAYAIWTGIGAVGTVILGIVLLGESTSWPKMICILLIALGILGLKLFGGEDVSKDVVMASSE